MAAALSLPLIGLPGAHGAESPYATSGLCERLPRISVTTPPGVCVGLLASGFKFPRGVLPAHAAPLGMTYYFGTALPQLHGKLIGGCHGYRKAGHRVVVFDIDAQGRPQGSGRELVAGWDAEDGRPMGAPTDVKAGADDAVYVTEDRNGTVLRIAADRQ